MKPPLRRLLLLGLPAGLALAATPAAPPPIAQQIDALLKRRLKPEPLPLDLPNPFVMSAKDLKESIVTASAPVDPPASDSADLVKPAANSDVLGEVISHLRFGGVIRLKDQIQIVINDTPRKEGDTIKVPYSGTQIAVRVQRIAPTEVVLRYLDVDATVRF